MRKQVKNTKEIENASIRRDEEEFDAERREKKATNTAFILMFPALIIAGIAAMYAPIWGSLIVVLLSFYQFLMLKKFIDDFYLNK